MHRERSFNDLHQPALVADHRRCVGKPVAWLANLRALLLLAAMIILAAGCGTTQSYKATEQLLMSDAVDATIAQLDFEPLAEKRVYLDATYLKTLKSPFLIDSDYVISSLRQQMLAANVLLVEQREEADLIAEARIGALGLDGHNVTYGVPASNAISSASSVFANAPVIPRIPELSLARREAKQGAAKIAVFAYERDGRKPVWQSGIAQASSSAKDMWILGVGPWQSGSIYEGTRFAGSKIGGRELLANREKELRQTEEFLAYSSGQQFAETSDPVAETMSEPALLPKDSGVSLASAIGPAAADQ